MNEWQQSIHDAVESRVFHEHTHTLEGVEEAVLLEVCSDSYDSIRDMLDHIWLELDEANARVGQIMHMESPLHYRPHREYVWVYNAYKSLRDTMIGYLQSYASAKSPRYVELAEEYIEEAEHQEGYAYWRANFELDNIQVLYEDFETFVRVSNEAADDNEVPF